MTVFAWILVAWFTLNAVASVAIIGQKIEYTVSTAIAYLFIAGLFIFGLVNGGLS